jgi:hypothetical protein
MGDTWREWRQAQGQVKQIRVWQNFNLPVYQLNEVNLFSREIGLQERSQQSDQWPMIIDIPVNSQW